MIDIESEVFSFAASKLRDGFAGIYVAGENTAAPVSYPAATIVQKSNVVDEKAIDSGAIENYADVMYEVNVYSNLETGKKQQTKAIMQVINTAFEGMGFVRQLCEPIDNAADPAIYRMLARYAGKIDNNKNIYRK